MNEKYDELKKIKWGSDNFTNQATQTFNYQFKIKEQQSNRIEKTEAGTYATGWDLYDESKTEQLTEFEILQKAIRWNIEKDLNDKLNNPFCLL